MSYCNSYSNALPRDKPQFGGPSANHQLSLLQAAFAAATDALFVFDGQRQLGYANRAAKQLCGRATDEKTVPQRCCEMFWRADGARVCLVERAMLGKRRIEIEMTLGTQSEARAIVIAAEPFIEPGAATATGATVVDADPVKLGTSVRAATAVGVTVTPAVVLTVGIVFLVSRRALS